MHSGLLNNYLLFLVMIKLSNIRNHLSNMNHNSTVAETLQKNLFSIQPVISEVDRKLLALAYTPGVGATCLDIQDNPLLAEEFTFRARAIAVVTDGSFLDISGKQVLPVIDWIIYQIKQYTGLDAFPFVVSQNIDLEAFLKDLSNSYGTVLYLDHKEPKEIPKDILFIKHQQILNIHKSERTDLNYTSTALSYLIQKGIKGHPDRSSYQTASVAPLVKKTFKDHTFEIQGEDVKQNARRFHRQYQGKIRIVNNKQLSFNDVKSTFTEQNILAAIKSQQIYSKTSKIAVIVTDGTAILGFGDIGPRAGLPVMQGKSLLFKMLGDVEVVPFCIHPRKNAEQEVEAIANSVGNFMAVNLEDIKAPQCFDIETGLKAKGLLPVFHDDQHGTAIVVLAALINGLKVAGKNPQTVKIVINGAGAAGITIAKLILAYKIENLIVCDTKGAIYAGRKEGMNKAKEQIAQITNKSLVKGSLDDVLEKADVFIGVSAAGALKGHVIKQKMNEKAIIFALANPTPQILPDEAKENNAFIYGSGRSDFENQINNSLVFPGIFRSIKQHHLKQITEDMKLRAAIALSNSLEREPDRQYIIPASLDKKLAKIISDEVGKGF